jgi:hypothetical protein
MRAEKAVSFLKELDSIHLKNSKIDEEHESYDSNATGSLLNSLAENNIVESIYENSSIDSPK